VSTISRAEQGRGLPNINSLRRLAAVIGCEPDALVRLAKEPEKAPAPRWIDEVGKGQEEAVSLAKIPGLTRGDRLGDRLGDRVGSATATVSPMLAAMVRVPHFGGVSAVRTEAREEDVGGERGVESSIVPDIGVDFTVSVDGQCMAPRYEDGERVQERGYDAEAGAARSKEPEPVCLRAAESQGQTVPAGAVVGGEGGAGAGDFAGVTAGYKTNGNAESVASRTPDQKPAAGLIGTLSSSTAGVGETWVSAPLGAAPPLTMTRQKAAVDKKRRLMRDLRRVIGAR
jgi:transcriptional regulator with XRE-family HTH domain